MKKYKVIHIKSESKSFSWNDGLFAIIKEEEGALHMVKIYETGLPQTFDDGRFMITCTGSGNKGITKTNLTFNVKDK